MTKNPIFRGAATALVTPLTEKGVDYAQLEKLINWQIEEGIDGLVIAGTTGEGSTLSDAEHRELFREAIKMIDGRVPAIAGTGSNDTAYAIDLTKYACEVGCDGLLVVTPYYNKATQKGLYEHFKIVADSVKIPVILYNIPGRTGVNLEVKTLARLAEDCSNIIGVKESNKDFEHVNRVLLNCGRDFLLYSGIELLCYPMLAIGGAGHISATACVAPKEVADLYNYWTAGEIDKALDLHYKLMPLNDVLFKETNPGPLKAAMGMIGKIHPAMRPPMEMPSGKLHDEIKETLQTYGYLESINQ